MALPGLPAAGLGLVVAVALVEAAGLLAGGGKATGLAVLVDGGDDPVDARVAADGLVLVVDQDHLVVLVGRVLVDPVGVQDAQVGAAAADTLLGSGLEGTLILELVHTLVGGLACGGRKMWSVVCSQRFRCLCISRLWEGHTIGGTLRDGLLAATTADTHAVDDIALLGLVSETAGLVGARGTRGAVDDVQLTELYCCSLSKMFNDCIARTESLAGTGVFLNSRQNVTAALRDESIQCPATPSTCISIEKRLFNILPSIGLGEGSAAHRTASSSVALRRTLGHPFLLQTTRKWN